MTGTISVVEAGDVQKIPYVSGMTIRQAFVKANIQVATDQEIRLNNKRTTDLDTTLADGDFLMATGAIAGAKARA